MYAGCASCANINKKMIQKAPITNHYRYGCHATKQGHILAWILNDNELKYMGCSKYKEPYKVEQATLF